MPSPVKSPPPVSRGSLRHVRYTRLDGSSGPQKVLDVTDQFIVLQVLEEKPHRVQFFHSEDDVMQPALTLPIPPETKLESFKMLSPTTAAVVFQREIDNGRRVMLLRAVDEDWRAVEKSVILDKPWMLKQHLFLVPQWNSEWLYISECHHDCIPDPSMPDFADPLYTFYRVNISSVFEENAVPVVELLNSISDNLPMHEVHSSLSSDGKSLLLIKVLFELSPPDCSNNMILTEYLEHPGYILKGMNLLIVYSLDLETKELKSKHLSPTFPRDVHSCTAASSVQLDHGRLHFSEPGGSLSYDIATDSFHHCQVLDGRSHQVISSSRSGVVGIALSPSSPNPFSPIFSSSSPPSLSFFRGCINTVPSLRAMAQSAVVQRLKENFEGLDVAPAEGLLRRLVATDSVVQRCCE